MGDVVVECGGVRGVRMLSFVFIFMVLKSWFQLETCTILFALLCNFHFICVHSYLFYVLTNYKEIYQSINQSISLSLCLSVSLSR